MCVSCEVDIRCVPGEVDNRCVFCEIGMRVRCGEVDTSYCVKHLGCVEVCVDHEVASEECCRPKGSNPS